MNWTSLGMTVVTVAIGALIGFGPSYLLEHRKERQGLRTRWDSNLYGVALDFLSTAENHRHVLNRLASEGTVAEKENRESLDEQRRSLWMLFVQMRFIGNARVQRAARLVIRHSWAYREVKEGRKDPRAGQFKENPGDRLSNQIYEFVRAVREQMRVERAEDIATDEPSDWPDPADRIFLARSWLGRRSGADSSPQREPSFEQF